MAQKFTQSKNWIFTDFQLLNWDIIFKSNEDIRFIGWGEEICPKTNRKHIQGWLQLYKKKRLAAMKKILGKEIHLETARGSAEQNEKYCSKDNKYKSIGDYTFQGKRTDLQTLYEEIMAGKKNLKDVADEQFDTYCKYRNGFKDAQKWADETNSESFRLIHTTVHSGDPLHHFSTCF